MVRPRGSSLFKALRLKEQEIITALGGDPSPQEQAIIADSVKNMLYIASLDNDLYGIEKPGAKRARASYPGDQNAVIGTPARESQNPWAQAGKQDAHGTRQCSTATMNQRVPRTPPACPFLSALGCRR